MRPLNELSTEEGRRPTWLRILIPGEPYAQPRARFRRWQARDGRSGVTTYDPAEARSWKAEARAAYVEALKAAGLTTDQGTLEPFAPSGPVELTVTAQFTCPKSDWRKREPRAPRLHTKKPDADNIVKAVKDAGKGVLWLDDAQVCRLIVEKWIGAQGQAPGVVVIVRRLDADRLLFSRNIRAALDKP